MANNRNDDKLDVLLRTSLCQDETPPPALQTEVIARIRNHKAKENLYCWLLAIVGAMQTVTLIIGARLIIQNALFTCLAVPLGFSFILCGFALPKVANQRWRRKEWRSR